MKRLIIACILSILLLSVAAATVYEWSVGMPAGAENQPEWCMGQPAVSFDSAGSQVIISTMR